MEPPSSTKRSRPKSKRILVPTSSSGPSHTAPSPELLQTIEQLQADLTELRSREEISKEEKLELAQLMNDLAKAKMELKASQTPASEPAPARSKRIVNYGTFSTVEE